MKIQEQSRNFMGLCKCTTGGKQQFVVQDDLQGVHEDKKPTAWANAACCAQAVFVCRGARKD